MGSEVAAMAVRLVWGDGAAITSRAHSQSSRLGQSSRSLCSRPHEMGQPNDPQRTVAVQEQEQERF